MTDIIAIIERARWTPLSSGITKSDLISVERRLDRKLPCTFRELHALDNGSAFLAHFSNSDSPIPLNELGNALPRWPNYDALTENILPFMIESQAVCVWGL